MSTASTEYDGTMRWFTQRFNADMYSGMPEVKAPIGEDCLLCEERIEEGDPGLTIPYSGDREKPAGQYPMHVECHLRSILGGPEHMDGVCSCKTDHPQDYGLSYRESATQVVEKFWGKNWKRPDA